MSASICMCVQLFKTLPSICCACVVSHAALRVQLLCTCVDKSHVLRQPDKEVAVKQRFTAGALLQL